MDKKISFSVNLDTKNIIINCGDKQHEIINTTVNADEIFNLLNFNIGDKYIFEDISFDNDFKFLVKPAESFKKLLEDIINKLKTIDISDSNNKDIEELK